MLYPGDDHRRLGTARLIDLENIHGDALGELFGSNRALGGRKGPVACSGKLIRGNAIPRIRLNDQAIAGARCGPYALCGDLGAHALDRDRTDAGSGQKSHP